MEILYLIIFFIFGALLASFYTVVGLRMPREENFVTNHSYCDLCKHELKLYDMIPILSYITLLGKCRYCHKKIDPLSTYMELFTGILFALAFSIFGFSWELAIALGIVSMLIIISVSDTNYLIIPDEILIFFSAYFIIFQVLDIGLRGTAIQILSGIFLFTLMYSIMFIGNKVLKKESMGGGDIKMMFVFGLVLDPLLGVLTIFLGSLFALPISLILLRKKHENLIPFGPFLLIAFTFIYFTQLTTPMILDFLRWTTI